MLLHRKKDTAESQQVFDEFWQWWAEEGDLEGNFLKKHTARSTAPRYVQRGEEPLLVDEKSQAA